MAERKAVKRRSAARHRAVRGAAATMHSVHAVGINGKKLAKSTVRLKYAGANAVKAYGSLKRRDYKGAAKYGATAARHGGAFLNNGIATLGSVNATAARGRNTAKNAKLARKYTRAMQREEKKDGRATFKDAAMSGIRSAGFAVTGQPARAAKAGSMFKRNVRSVVYGGRGASDASRI